MCASARARVCVCVCVCVCAQDANCACVLARSAPGPVMSDVVFTRQWLPYAAGVLEEQDRVDEFRQRAIDLIQMDKLQRRPSDIPGMPGSHSLKPGTPMCVCVCVCVCVSSTCHCVVHAVCTKSASNAGEQ